MLGTRGQDGPGEIAVRIRGAREDFIAYSDEPIPAGATALVIGMRSNRVVTVIAWPGIESGSDG